MTRNLSRSRLRQLRMPGPSALHSRRLAVGLTIMQSYRLPRGKRLHTTFLVFRFPRQTERKAIRAFWKLQSTFSNSSSPSDLSISPSTSIDQFIARDFRRKATRLKSDPQSGDSSWHRPKSGSVTRNSCRNSIPNTDRLSFG